MKNIHNTLNEAAAAATATFRELTSKLLKNLRNRPQKEYGFGSLFINTRNRRGWAREDLSGKLQLKCPCCAERSLYYLNAGHDQLPDGTKFIDISVTPIGEKKLTEMVYNRFNKSASMQQQSAAEANRQDQIDNANVPVTTREMRPRTTHKAYDLTRIVDVEDRTTLDGRPNSEALREELWREGLGVSADDFTSAYNNDNFTHPQKS
tara:strand:+ start:3693 stop:4313 length:621 start_codon:yes stop_codon:yes gene_type:complete